MKKNILKERDSRSKGPSLLYPIRKAGEPWHRIDIIEQYELFIVAKIRVQCPKCHTIVTDKGQYARDTVLTFMCPECEIPLTVRLRVPETVKDELTIVKELNWI